MSVNAYYFGSRTIRRLAISNKKLRGVPRRLRALRKWSESFKDYFPQKLRPTDLYRNFKIPVHLHLVEGSQTSRDIQRQCAQQMLEAIARIQKAKPPQIKARVTCVIMLPDMFSSELCIFFDEAYFQSFMQEATSDWKTSNRIGDHRLSEEWSLMLPSNCNEIGMSVNLKSIDDDWEYHGEHWYFGDLS